MIAAVYNRKEALSLTAKQMASMGLRTFDTPTFRVGGAYRQEQDDILQVSAISCILDSRQILDEVTFTTKSGKILTIAGPNGTGKSTLCRIITGLYRATGTVSLNDELLKRKCRTKESFFVQQDSDYQLYAPTVLDEFFLGIKETADRKEKSLSLLREMGLSDFLDRHPASLSGGQKQRLLLALSAASERSLLVFDEPTSGLDGLNMHITIQLLKRLAEGGRCILLITHDMELIAEAADSVLYLESGKAQYHRNIQRKQRVCLMILHSSGEDYLKAILVLQKEKRKVRSIDIAAYMGVSKPSVSHAVKLLRKGGFLTKDSDHSLHLTDLGKETVEKLYERYQYFAEHLASAGVDSAVAEEEACLMEHTISDDSFRRLKEHSQSNCPFADSCEFYLKKDISGHQTKKDN